MKTGKWLLLLFGLFFLSTSIYAQKKPFPAGKTITFSFEKIPAGEIPSAWKVEATNQHGPLASWQVVTDSTAPSGRKVLALTRPNHNFGGTFNLCWSDQIQFLNGVIKVYFKANSGVEDQGGGVMWRVRDKDNYYISRYNPLENNFRIYYVKDGARRMLASARIHLPAHTWQELKIVQKGDKISGYLNGKKLLEVEDNTFSNSGGVGLWTKADAVTSFDDFSLNIQK